MTDSVDASSLNIQSRMIRELDDGFHPLERDVLECRDRVPGPDPAAQQMIHQFHCIVGFSLVRIALASTDNCPLKQRPLKELLTGILASLRWQ